MNKIPLIMGIVNATGNSFSEGAASDPESALDRALKLLDDGADIIDIGAESTRPGAAEVPAEQECEVITKFLEQLFSIRPGVQVSVDTRHAVTAAKALELGAAYINDVSMLRHDDKMADCAAKYDAKLILCHSRGTPLTMKGKQFCCYSDVVDEVKEELSGAAEKAVACGVKRENIIFDPGFGFAKDVVQQLEMLVRAHEFCALGKTLVGLSRKSFLGALTGVDEPQERVGSTLCAELQLAECNIDIIRTHNVRYLRDALTVKKYLEQ